MDALDLTTGQSIAGLAILAVFGVMAVWQSFRPRVRSVDADPRAWINGRIAAERDPGKRAAWRDIRDNPKED